MTPPSWHNAVPWLLTLTSAIVLGMIAYFLVENINWFRNTAFSGSASEDLVFRMHVHHLHLATLKRAVGLFSGFSMVFLGLGVAFRQVEYQTKIRAETPNLAITLVSASPGVIAMVLGLTLLITAIISKDQFPIYRSTPQGLPTGTYNRPDSPAGFLEARPDAKNLLDNGGDGD